MPIYKYQCDPCAFRFEETRSSSAESLGKCPKCSNPSRRLIPGSLSSSFGIPESNRGEPPNQGVSTLDYVADQAIGNSARQGWEVIERRNEDKRRLRRENPGHSVVKQADGTYGVVPNTVAVPHQVQREQMVRDLASNHRPAPLQPWLEEALQEAKSSSS